MLMAVLLCASTAPSGAESKAALNAAHAHAMAVEPSHIRLTQPFAGSRPELAQRTGACSTAGWPAASNTVNAADTEQIAEPVSR
ncbi:hypothetical protein GCM10027610_036060 [Dactylosporangium cerinum]